MLGVAIDDGAASAGFRAIKSRAFSSTPGA
jgi:hypothetical protein